MKLFAFHSPSFDPLWKLFTNSVKRTSFELHAIKCPIDGCVYGEPQYWQLMKWLGEQRLRLICEERKVFCTTGCDSIFLKDPVDDLFARIVNCDFLAADDLPHNTQLCGCLEVILPCDSTLELFRKIYSDPRAGTMADDPLLNHYRDTTRWKALPHNLYWNQTGRRWNSGDPIAIPPREAYWAHANWTVGLPNKLQLMTTWEQWSSHA